MFGTGELLGKKHLFGLIGIEYPQQPLAPQQGQLYTFGNARPFVVGQYHPVDDQVHVVLLKFF